MAATGTVADVLVVFGVWAAVSGAAQLVVALRRRAQLGWQRPHALTGEVSVIAGIVYVGAAAGDDPMLVLELYAATGGVEDVGQAWLAARRRGRPHPSPTRKGVSMVFETLTVRDERPVVFVEIAAPPMNLLTPELVRDLVSLIQETEADEAVRVLVFTSADPDYFISHVDVTRIDEYRAEASKLTGEPSLALLFHYLSESRLVTIAQIEGRVRGVGSEFVLATDMRFAARESAIFSQFEPAFGVLPGGGATQHLVRLMGRSRRSR